MNKIIVAIRIALHLEISNALFVIDVSDVINEELFTWNLSEVMQNTEEKVSKNQGWKKIDLKKKSKNRIF